MHTRGCSREHVVPKLRMATEGTSNTGSSEPPAGVQTASATTGQPHLAVQDLKTLVSFVSSGKEDAGEWGRGWVGPVASSSGIEQEGTRMIVL